jgi:hypothetical protein
MKTIFEGNIPSQKLSMDVKQKKSNHFRMVRNRREITTGNPTKSFRICHTAFISKMKSAYSVEIVEDRTEIVYAT